MQKISFDELVAKREQAKADKLAVTEIAIPGADRSLQFKKPTDAQMLEIFGRFAETAHVTDGIAVADYAIYHCCEDLQNTELHKALGVADPNDVVKTLFTIPERNQLGLKLINWLGFGGSSEENPAKN